MLSDLIRTIVSPSEEELSDIIDNCKEEERYTEVLGGKFGGGILMLLDDLKTHTSGAGNEMIKPNIRSLPGY